MFFFVVEFWFISYNIGCNIVTGDGILEKKKQKIIDLVNGIDNPRILEFIFIYIERLKSKC